MNRKESTTTTVLGALFVVVVVSGLTALSWFIFRAKHPDAPWWTFFL